MSSPARPTPTDPTPDGVPVTLVTGASSGIGRATALLLARKGHALVLVARRREVLAEVAAECLAAGAESAVVHAVDVTDDAGLLEVVRATVRRTGRLDHAIHCAGVVTYGRTEEVDADEFRSVIETNLLGTANLARHVVPVLREQRRGSLVVVGSLLGHLSVPEMTPYVASKWAVRALTRQIAIENLDLHDVHVVHVSPGSVDTPIYGNALSSAGAVNRPPPPSISPERAARTVVRALGGKRHSVQTQWVNYAMIAAHDTAPWVWDRVVGPVFRLASRGGGDVPSDEPDEPDPRGDVLGRAGILGS